MARDLAGADDEPELASWDQVHARGPDRTVNFGRPMDGTTLRLDSGPRITNMSGRKCGCSSGRGIPASATASPCRRTAAHTSQARTSPARAA
jgi:hypothetical protein